MHQSIHLGVSPRGSLALMRACQAYALLKGRSYVTPDDVQYLMPFVFGHRITLHPGASYEGITVEEIIESILLKVEVPVDKVPLHE